MAAPAQAEQWAATAGSVAVVAAGDHSADGAARWAAAAAAIPAVVHWPAAAAAKVVRLVLAVLQQSGYSTKEAMT